MYTVYRSLKIITYGIYHVRGDRMQQIKCNGISTVCKGNVHTIPIINYTYKLQCILAMTCAVV